MRLVFLGPPGCGKGTQARLLKERLGLDVIGTGDILRDAVKRQTLLGKQVETYLTSGLLAPDALVNDIVSERFRRNDRPTKFIMDGYPRTLAQTLAFESVLREIDQNLSCVVLFAVPDEELVRRIGGRRANESRTDDNEETVRKRLAVYHANANDMLEHFRASGLLRTIDATGDVETVYKSIVQACGA